MNPYRSLDPKAFWRPAVADRSMFDIEGLWEPKFNLRPGNPVVTFGSCFAQHIGKYLAAAGYNWLIAETTPRSWPAPVLEEFGYGLFSARTGNIYTTSLLRQWTEWALDRKPVPDQVWEQDGRFFDPFRPAIEPGGFASADELLASRRRAIRAFRACIEQARFFIFTMGLTESWFDAETGIEYPMCPGTIAGTHDPDRHQFLNQDYERIRYDLLEVVHLMKAVNSRLEFILTVSPVPLTATMSGRHVAVATMASKSILRAVADHVANTRADVDYFPSYEIIAGPVFKGVFFQQNQRSVHPAGVDFVMKSFFGGLQAKFGGSAAPVPAPATPVVAPVVANDLEDDDEHCEEAMLAVFGSRR